MANTVLEANISQFYRKHHVSCLTLAFGAVLRVTYDSVHPFFRIHEQFSPADLRSPLRRRHCLIFGGLDRFHGWGELPQTTAQFQNTKRRSDFVVTTQKPWVAQLNVRARIVMTPVSRASAPKGRGRWIRFPLAIFISNLLPLCRKRIMAKQICFCQQLPWKLQI